MVVFVLLGGLLGWEEGMVDMVGCCYTEHMLTGFPKFSELMLVSFVKPNKKWGRWSWNTRKSDRLIWFNSHRIQGTGIFSG